MYLKNYVDDNYLFKFIENKWILIAKHSAPGILKQYCNKNKYHNILFRLIKQVLKQKIIVTDIDNHYHSNKENIKLMIESSIHKKKIIRFLHKKSLVYLNFQK